MTTPPRSRAARRFEPLPLPIRWWERVPVATLTLTLVFAVLVGISLVLPVPYAVRMPGPTVDTLGSADGVPLISIAGVSAEGGAAAENDDDDAGQLRLTTVSASGGPGYPVTALQALHGFFDPRSSVLPREAVFPRQQTAEEAKEQGQAQMTSSQEAATFAALTALGYEVPARLVVAGVVEDGAAVGVMEEGDVATAIEVGGERTELVTFTDLLDVLAQTPPGTDVVIEVERGGERIPVTLTTGGSGEGGSVLGILVDPQFDFPVEVTIQIHNIGGPSAGMMFALGIMELLTPGETVGDHVVAGTGSIDLQRDVGTIGGIVQKMNGSVRDGAEYFLAPSGNCDEVVGNVPGGLQVIAVSTLDEAWAALEAIGQDDAAGLPSCG